MHRRLPTLVRRNSSDAPSSRCLKKTDYCHGLLGLAVVRSIVSSHGGAINVFSAPAQGTTFQIDLPCMGEPSNPDGSVAVGTSDERIAGTGTTGIVLLVE